MPVTLTIKQVPDALAARLKKRAAGQRRSLQKELLSIMEDAVEWEGVSAATLQLRAAEPASVAYVAHPTSKHEGSVRAAASGRLTLDQLWQRARRLGTGMAGESTAIVRRDRDGRQLALMNAAALVTLDARLAAAWDNAVAAK